MIPINVIMRFIDFDLYFIEDRFCADKEIASRRIGAPNNSRSAINFYGKITIREQPIKRSKITRQDRIFGVLKVCVFHTVSMAWSRGQIKQVCGGCLTVTPRIDPVLAVVQKYNHILKNLHKHNVDDLHLHPIFDTFQHDYPP